jgi:hypothetical protein
MSITIADFPAYRIYKPYTGRKFRHGEKIAIPFETRNHGVLWHFYTLGTVAGYAVQNGECPIKRVTEVEARNAAARPYDQHRLYWANADSVCIHNGPVTKREVPGFNIGDELILQGHRFRIDRAPNDNIDLVLLGAA